MPKSAQGFTLVELLVVISVIAVLSVIGITIFSGVQRNARDAKRRADIKAIHQALEQWKVRYGSYTQPEAMCRDTSYGGLGECGSSSGDGNWDTNSNLRDLVTGGFIQELPKDPINNTTYYYEYEPTNQNEGSVGELAGSRYSLCAVRLESSSGSYCLNSQL